MKALRLAADIIARAESMATTYAVFVRGDAVEYLPEAGPACARRMADPGRAALRVATVGPGACAAVLAARLREAGVVDAAA